MIPQQTFESYPVFGDNATKVKPDDAKYAAGFQQADVLPAEWMNWAWAKNTKGITDANAGLSSIEEEIINVLTSREKQPSASDNTQLLTVLNMIKAEAALAAHPVGSLYWTSSTENPATTFGGGTWSQIKDKFILAAGDTYKNGATGGAATVTLTADQIPSHNHSFTPSGSVSVTTNPTFTGSEHSHSYTPAGSVSVTTNPTFTGSEHSHTYTPAGSVSVTTNPTFTGSAVTSGANNRGHTHSYSHTHGYTPSGKIASTSGGTDNKTAGMSAHSTGSFQISWNTSNTRGLVPYTDGTTFKSSKKTGVIAAGSTQYSEYSNLNNQVEMDISHTHNAYFTGSAGTTTSQSTTTSGDESQNHTHSVTASGTISGGSYKFTGTQATLKATAGGSISGGVYSFTGTAATLKATAGGSISGGAYSFTGTAGTTGSKGGGGAHNNMPPYIVKYCWERVS